MTVAPAAPSPALGHDRLVVDGAGQQFIAGLVGDLDQDFEPGQVGQYLGQPWCERGVVEQRRRPCVGQQILQLTLDVAVVDVERGDPRTPGAQHALDVLGSVVGIDAEQILPDLVAGELVSFGMTAQAAGMQIGGQPVRTLDDLRVGEPAVTLDDELAIADHGGDGVGGGGHGELDRVGHDRNCKRRRSAGGHLSESCMVGLMASTRR